LTDFSLLLTCLELFILFLELFTLTVIVWLSQFMGKVVIGF
jgi:hypothetical protein